MFLYVCATVDTVVGLFEEMLDKADDDDRNKVKAFLGACVEAGVVNTTSEWQAPFSTKFGIDVDYARIGRLFTELD